MVKKGNSFAKMAVVFVALLVGLGFMGVGVSYWSDTLLISGTVNTGNFTHNLSATDNSTSPPGGSVTCEVDSHALKVTVIGADKAYAYYGHFTIENNGTIPLKMLVDESTVPQGVVAQIINVVGDGTVDPEETEDGKVHIYLENSSQKGETFTVITNAVMWNQ